MYAEYYLSTILYFYFVCLKIKLYRKILMSKKVYKDLINLKYT
jgi:hypothetical protein